MKNINWKKILPYLIIIIGFLIVSYSFMSPVLQGKMLYQYDIAQSKGMNKEIVDARENGKQILWTNRPFAGMPAFLLTVKYKYNIIYYVKKCFYQIFMFGNATNQSAFLVFLMIFGFFLCAKMLSINNWLSAAIAVAFGLSTFWLVSLEAGHNSKLVTYTHLATSIGALIFAYRKNAIWGAILFAFFFGLSLDAHHLQITYYTFLIGVIFVLSELFFNLKENTMSKFLKTTGFLIVASVFAIGLNANHIYTTYVHTKETTRGGKSEMVSNTKDSESGLGYNYATAWSYGIKETGTLIIANFAGGASTGKLSESSETYKALLKNRMPKSQARKTIERLPIYYGKQSFTAGPTYVGAIICFLFMLALFILPNKDRWWILAASLLSAFLAWGSQSFIFDFFYYYVPLFNKFRAPAMAFAMVTFLFPLAAMLALNKIFFGKVDKEKLQKALFFATGITAGFCLVSFLFGSAFWNFRSAADAQLPSWLLDAMISDRKSVFKWDALRSMVLILLSFGALWLFLKEKINYVFALSIIAILTIGDLYNVGKNYLTSDDFKRPRDYKKSLRVQFNDAELKKDKSQFRIWNANSQLDKDGITSYSYNSLSGYSAAKLLLYQDLIDYQLSKGNQPALNMLNTKYVVQKSNAIKNPNACGNAWFANKITYANNAKDVMNKLNNFDACNEAIVETKLQNKIGNVSKNNTGKINLIKNEGDKLVYNISGNKQNNLAVFSEIYYKAGGGWKAKIDGKVAEVLKVNYALRGLVVPKNAKQIVFTFNPSFYRNAELISLIFSVLFLLTVGFFTFNWYKTKKANA